jgi:hypothetical protein
MFPTGRKKPTNNVSGRTNLHPNIGRLFPDNAKKGPILKMFLFPLFFPQESIENLEFSQISVLVWFQNLVFFDKTVLKMQIYQRAELFYSADSG